MTLRAVTDTPLFLPEVIVTIFLITHKKTFTKHYLLQHVTNQSKSDRFYNLCVSKSCICVVELSYFAQILARGLKEVG